MKASALVLLGAQLAWAFTAPPCSVPARRAPFHPGPSTSRWVGRSSRSVQRAASDVTLVEADETADPIVLRCTETGRAIECYVDAFATVASIPDVRYCIAYPCDPAVAICTFDQHGNLEFIDDEDERMDELYQVSSQLLEEEELYLMRTATTLTLQGDLELDEDYDEDEDEEQEEEDEQAQFELGEDGEDEFVEELMQFEHDEETYVLVRLTTPMLLIGKEMHGSTEYQLLEPNEAERVKPFVEKQLEKEWGLLAEHQP